MPTYYATGEAEEGLAAATAETLIFVAGATTQKARIIEWGVSFDGVSATAEPVQVKIKRGNSASQGTFTAATEEKADPDDPAAACTAFHSSAGEPTYTGQPLMHVNVHPQGGIFVWQARSDEDALVLDDSANSFIGIEATAPATVNAAFWIAWKE